MYIKVTSYYDFSLDNSDKKITYCKPEEIIPHIKDLLACAWVATETELVENKGD